MDIAKNFAYGTVATAPSPATSGTSLVLNSGQGALFADPATEGAYNIVVWPVNARPLASNAEIIRVTAKSTDTLTIVRQQEGTSARTIVVGDQVGMNPTALQFANAMKVIAAPVADHTASGIKIELTASVTMNFGDVGIIDGNSKVALPDADAIATSIACVMCVDSSISADASGNFMLFGIARDDTWAWTVGGLIYLTVTGTTGNTLSQTAPTGTDDVILPVGIATHADRILFKPGLIAIEHT